MRSLDKRRAYAFELFVAAAAVLLYCLNRFTDCFLSVPFLRPFFRYHFNDMLGTVLFSAYWNLLLLWKGFRPWRRLGQLLLIGCLCAAVWEGVMPLLLPYSTADWLDCIAYLGGAALYWLMERCFLRD